MEGCEEDHMWWLLCPIAAGACTVVMQLSLRDILLAVHQCGMTFNLLFNCHCIHIMSKPEEWNLDIMLLRHCEVWIVLSANRLIEQHVSHVVTRKLC